MEHGVGVIEIFRPEKICLPGLVARQWDISPDNSDQTPMIKHCHLPKKILF
ncbi:hypothetical protein GbCGDNIH6_7167 [Granulibacter bethesdensis]|nr:hypothetical protein GbCGDNIH6_7167 [Granulibacter bethesdensis]